MLSTIEARTRGRSVEPAGHDTEQGRVRRTGGFIIEILQEYGCGCDCSSYAELVLADACGAHGSDIMFSSNETPEEDFKLASQLGATINLDDITHIDVLESVDG